MKYMLSGVMAAFVATAGHADTPFSSIDPVSIPAYKKINHDRYLSSQDAHRLLRSEPSILFVDVRDPVEIAIMGHPDQIDAIVPVNILGMNEDGRPRIGELVRNQNFFDEMEEVLAENNKSKHDFIIITCGSGRRSAVAARALYNEGYTNVWHVTDGYEGDEHTGFNRDNAWKAAGLPWSMDLMWGSQWRLKLPE